MSLFIYLNQSPIILLISYLWINDKQNTKSAFLIDKKTSEKYFYILK